MELSAALMILCTAFVYGKAQQFDFESQVGVVDVKQDGKLCLVIHNPSLSTGVSINLVVLSNRQWVTKASIKEKSGQSCSDNPDTGDASFYLLELEPKNKAFKIIDRPAVAVAVVSSAPVKVLHGKASLDLDKDGRREFFRSCTSNEGLHLAVWTGKPLQGKRRWHFYYYLGYDVVPSCKKKDYMRSE